MPERILMNISDLDIGDALHVSDVELPEGARILEDPTATIVNILSPRKIVEVKPEEEGLLIGEELEEPELITEEEAEKEEVGEEKKFIDITVFLKYFGKLNSRLTVKDEIFQIGENPIIRHIVEKELGQNYALAEIGKVKKLDIEHTE